MRLTYLNKLLSEKTSSTADHWKRVYKLANKNSQSVSKAAVLDYIRNSSLSDDKKAELIKSFRSKVIRTQSGVAPITLLTMPYPCPGNCIFCPSDVKMPKSYLASEPGAQRAVANKFDPYAQVYNRLVALHNNGHSTDKAEVIILGGTWSYYPIGYRIWFITRCFNALNDFTAKDLDKVYAVKPVVSTDFNSTRFTWPVLFKAQRRNETAKTRCVGLVVETRPDFITKEELVILRKLGVTKVQLGVQSLNAKVLYLNNRGTTVDQIKNAFKLLRSFGFKIQAHWMANLYGSDPELDLADFKKLFGVPFRPDELKIYPCSLISGTVLETFYTNKLWKPYSEAELVRVLSGCIIHTPRYCRVTRVIRDISSDDIVAGNKKTNLRQIVEDRFAGMQVKPVEIRYREIKSAKINPDELKQKITKYKTAESTEYFIEFITPDDLIAGFIRLSLQKDWAVIREIHIYGESLAIGDKATNKAQHTGLGRRLISIAENITTKSKHCKLFVISSIGTRQYYNKNGFKLTKDRLYQVKTLKTVQHTYR